MTPKQVARFWSFAEKSGECWLWTGNRLPPKGYGRIQFDKHLYFAHRLAWEITHGAIPPGMCVCHHCDTPACVNPKHLFLGTNADNMADKYLKGRYRGPNQAPGTLDRTTVRIIRAKYASGQYSRRQLAQEYGCSPSNIRSIIKRETWQHA